MALLSQALLQLLLVVMAARAMQLPAMHAEMPPKLAADMGKEGFPSLDGLFNDAANKAKSAATDVAHDVKDAAHDAKDYVTDGIRDVASGVKGILGDNGANKTADSNETVVKTREDGLLGNLTAAETAAHAATELTVQAMKTIAEFKVVKAEAQKAGQEALHASEVTANNTRAAIKASEKAFQTLADKVNGRKTKGSVIDSTKLAKLASTEALEAAIAAKDASFRYQVAEDKAEVLMNSTMKLADIVGDKVNETLVNGRTARGILDKKLEAYESRALGRAPPGLLVLAAALAVGSGRGRF